VRTFMIGAGLSGFSYFGNGRPAHPARRSVAKSRRARCIGVEIDDQAENRERIPIVNAMTKQR